jgi:hypothetical protein
MLREAARAFLPTPLKQSIKKLILRRSLGSYKFRLSLGAVVRPHYAHIVFNAARLAARLGYPKISVLEYGVAGGRGLLTLENHALEIEKLFPVKIDIYGFDTGKGLPSPKDYRDLPYHWREGFFRMEQDDLKVQLKRARLVLGPIEETAKTFFQMHKPAPIGAIIHDFDFYSSTAAGLEMLRASDEFYLPRVFCYFDDTIGDEIALYSDYTGQRLAIREFNQGNESIKLSPVYYTYAKSYETWHRQIWVCHRFAHSGYGTFVSEENQQLQIDPSSVG